MNEARRRKLEDLQSALEEIQQGVDAVREEEQGAIDRYGNGAVVRNPQIAHMEGNVKCLKDAVDQISEAMTSIEGAMMLEKDLRYGSRHGKTTRA